MIGHRTDRRVIAAQNMQGVLYALFRGVAEDHAVTARHLVDHMRVAEVQNGRDAVGGLERAHNRENALGRHLACGSKQQSTLRRLRLQVDLPPTLTPNGRLERHKDKAPQTLRSSRFPTAKEPSPYEHGR